MSNILSEINRVREIMGLVTEQSNVEQNVSFRSYPSIDAARVDKFSLQAINPGEATILKNGIPITADIDGQPATVTGVRAVGNKLIIDIDVSVPIIGKVPQKKTMGEFVLDEITNTYKFEPNESVYNQLDGENKADFDAFVAAVQQDKVFATQILTAVMEGTDFNPSEYGIEIAVTEPGEDIVVSEEYPLIEGEDRETFTGKGTMIWSNAQQQGEFNGGKLNGQGKEIWTMIDEDEWIVKNQGEFKGGSLDGQGTVTYPDGGQYVGEFKDGSFDGEGAMTYANGTIEKGIFAEGDYIQGTTTFTDGTEEEKKRIEDFSWPSNISQEMQEWAKEQVSFRLDMLQDGVTSTMDEEGLEEYREQIIRLQEEPVSVAREEKVWYCEQFKDGAVSDVLNYEEKCLTYTELLLTQGTDETVDVKQKVNLPTSLKVSVDAVVPSKEILEYTQTWILYCETGQYDDADEIDPDWFEGACDGNLNGTTFVTLKTDPVTAVKEMLAFQTEADDQENVDELTTLLATLSSEEKIKKTCAEQNLCDDPANPGECIECIDIEVASELPLKGCTDPDYDNHNPLATIDDGSCKGFNKTVKDLKGELKTQWQKEVKTQLDIVGKGDIYGFGEAYKLQNENKLEAVLVMLNNLLCVSAHVAKALLLTQNRTMKYAPEKLIIAADSPGTGEGHIDLVDGIKRNLKLIDRSFKWWKDDYDAGGKKLGKEIDSKIKPIKTQLNRASDFIDALIPYINWDEDITFSDGSTHRAISTHDILINSKNKRQTIVNCAEQ